MRLRKSLQVLSIFALLMGFFHTPVQAAFGIRFGISVDVKQFPVTKQGTVRVFADSMDPITDPIIGMNCYNGLQVASNQCQYTVSGNEMIRATAFSQRIGAQTFQYTMCEVDNRAPNFLSTDVATDQNGSNNNAWTNKAAPLFTWPALTDPPAYCADGSPSGYASGTQGYKVYFGTNASGGPNDPSIVTVTTPSFDPNRSLASGVYYLRVQPFDQWNNAGAWQTLYTYKLDTANPFVSLSPQILPDGQNDWYSKVTLGLMLQTTDLYNNLAKTEWRVNGGPWGTGSQIDLSGDGIYTIDVMITDQAGNIGMAGAELKVDRTPIPFGMVQPAITQPIFKFPTWYTADVTLLDKTTIAKQVADVSGIQAVQFKNDDGSWTVVAPTFTQSGKYTVEVQTQDVAGNMDSGTVTIQLDKDKPSLKATLDTQNALSTKTARLLVTASDQFSGVGSVSYHIDAMGVHDITTINTNGDFIQDIDLSGAAAGKHTLTVQTADVAGNYVIQTLDVSTETFPIYLPVVIR